MFLAPFITTSHQLPVPSFHTEWVAALLGILATYPLLSTAYSKNIQIPQISLVFIGLVVILGIQWALGMLHSSQYALLILSYFVWAFLLVLLGSYLRRKLGWDKLATTLAWFLVIAGIINTGIVVLQFVTLTGGVIPFLPNFSSYGALSQPNHFADFTALATASLIYLYAKKRFSLSSFTLMLICFLMTLSFSGSRSSWLYLAAITACAALMQSNAVKQHRNTTVTRSLLRVGILLLPLFAVVQLFIYYVIPNELINLPTERLVDAASASTSSARLHIWYDSLRLFLQSPWLGIGAGAMRAESFKLLDNPTAMSFNLVFEHAHNIFLQLLTEMGIGAFLIILTGSITWFRSFKWRELNLETWWLISLLAVLSIHSMLEYPLWFTYFLGIAAILLGAGSEKFVSFNLPKSVGGFFTHQVGSTSVRILLTTAFIMGAANLGILIIANTKLENWVQQWATNDLARQDKELDWATQHSLLSPYAELLSVMSMNINATNIDQKVALSASILRFKPLRKITYQHALLLELKGDHVNAVKQLNRSLIAYPTDVKDILGFVPLEYQQRYLELLYEVRPELRDTTPNTGAS